VLEWTGRPRVVQTMSEITKETLMSAPLELKSLLLAMSLGLASLGLVACGDDAGDDVGDAVEETGEAVEETADEAGDAVEETTEEVQENNQ
jgi:hypothetical protein